MSNTHVSYIHTRDRYRDLDHRSRDRNGIFAVSKKHKALLAGSKRGSSESQSASVRGGWPVPPSHLRDSSRGDYNSFASQELIGYLRGEQQWLSQRLALINARLQEAEAAEKCRNQLAYLLDTFSRDPATSMTAATATGEDGAAECSNTPMSRARTLYVNTDPLLGGLTSKSALHTGNPELEDKLASYLARNPVPTSSSSSSSSLKPQQQQQQQQMQSPASVLSALLPQSPFSPLHMPLASPLGKSRGLAANNGSDFTSPLSLLNLQTTNIALLQSRLQHQLHEAERNQILSPLLANNGVRCSVCVCMNAYVCLIFTCLPPKSHGTMDYLYS